MKEVECLCGRQFLPDRNPAKFCVVCNNFFKITESYEIKPGSVTFVDNPPLLTPNEIMADPVNHPSHYNRGKIEVIEFIEDQDLPFNLGNAVKYIARCRYKGTIEQDLEKAIWYLRRQLELEKSLLENRKPCRPNEMNK